MKPPTIKLNDHYSLKYIQIPYDDRYYVVMRGNTECCKIKHTEHECLMYFVLGIRNRLNLYKADYLDRRMVKFELKVFKKNQLLDKAYNY